MKDATTSATQTKLTASWEAFPWYGRRVGRVIDVFVDLVRQWIPHSKYGIMSQQTRTDLLYILIVFILLRLLQPVKKLAVARVFELKQKNSSRGTLGYAPYLRISREYYQILFLKIRKRGLLHSTVHVKGEKPVVAVGTINTTKWRWRGRILGTNVLLPV